MYKKIISFVMALASLLTYTSCMDNENIEYVYDDDSAITAFTLGNVQFIAGKKKLTGADSIVSRDYSSYKFQIDQLGGRIYNVDSLPLGAMASKVLCSVSAINAGVVGLKGIDNDTVKYFSKTDTIDFTKPRTLIVYSNSGLGFRRYSVEVNVHKQDGNAFVWQQMPALPEEMRNLKGLKLYSAGTHLYITGNSAAATATDNLIYSAPAANPTAWTRQTTYTATEAWPDPVSNGSNLYILYKKGVSAMGSATNGAAPTDIDNTTALTRLVGATPSRLYANIEGRGLVSAATGATAMEWSDESTDGDDVALFPTLGTACVTLPLTTNKDTYQLIAVGHNSGDKHSSVWSKIEDGNSRQAWMLYPEEDYNHMRLPAYDNLQLGAYNGNMIALGNYNNKAPEAIYRSVDKGLTWQKDTLMALPKDLNTNGTVAFTVDSNNFIWIVCGDTGQVWRGRHNFLGWARPQEIFETKPKK